MSLLNIESLEAEISNLAPNGFAIGLDFQSRVPAGIKTTYSGEWQQHYADQGLITSDPTIDFGLIRTGTTTWDALSTTYDESRTIRAATDFGMMQGNTLVMAIDGRRVIASFCGKPWSAVEAKYIKGLVGAYSLLRLPDALPCPDPLVSDVLELMASDLRDIEIADRLGIKPVTVSKRRIKAKNLLGVTTIGGLISKAKNQGWI